MALVELHVREKIVYESFKTQKQLNESILNFIENNKTDKIVFKGDPYELNYKILKKILSEDSPLVYNGDYRGAFRKILKMTNYDPLCMIYKK
jgi:predicted nucleotide-binding protein (sugar kinase/HSP70/actin superfamily)